MNEPTNAGPSDRSSRPPLGPMFLFLLCAYLITCPGRMGSSDSYSQLQAAALLVRTGWFGSDDPEAFGDCSVVFPQHQAFQGHDPGNSVLLLPAAVVARLVDSQGGPSRTEIPVPARVVASLIYAVVGAGCVTAVFGMLWLVTTPGIALAGTLLTAFATPIWIYARCTMDVLPAALGTALATWSLLAHAQGKLPSRQAALLTAMAIALACWFRLSLLPFLAGPAAICLYSNANEKRLRTVMMFSIGLGLLMGPVLGFNAIRSGNPLILGTMHPRFADQNGFSGRIDRGLATLFVAPNHGIFVFAPWMLMAFALGGLRVLSPAVRRVLALLLLGTAAYVLTICAMRQPAKVEWGPRYLVPVLPVLIIPAVLGMARLWTSRWRWLAAGLAIVSVLITIPAGVSNYSYVLTNIPGATQAFESRPNQIIGSFQVTWLGLVGDKVAGQVGVVKPGDPFAQPPFPDFLVARVWERGGFSRIGSVVALSGLLIGLLVSTRLLARSCQLPSKQSDLKQSS